MSDESWFERLAEEAPDVAPQARAPATLRSRIYSALVARMAETGPLLDLAQTKETARLCVFEQALTVLPLGTGIRSMNPCRICHARVLGERVERAPIFWPGCPYSEFHHG